MVTGALATVEKLFWAMVWIIFLLIVAFYVLGIAENKGGDNFIGKIATWVNEHARPQAN